MKYGLRLLEFEGEQEFVQGHGMTWDSVVIDVPDDEEIVDVEAGFSGENARFNCLRPVVRVWLMKVVT